ncbi:penicillin acylase family protein [Flavobacterium gawalongense]|uniref:Penicillin acylase family protein n=1 Tax=Flavobacterium gawalongense TaxID=2594432 RepID=A0ABY3CMR7_9FLAO|nr:penicillin acylase family protein [Flavobacterium gawalongense]TRX02377.1 penicillin acylase family protein [Flavobacterium gawalongense]TRX07794.1 penicillin acylase family protein [Flavobacterium gawalongense]
MKKLKKLLLVLLSLVVIITIALIGYGFYLKPKYDGEVQLKNIQKETTVYFDEFGVPHIYANNSKDAMEALGYVHAQDRLWQMELMRRIAPGRLSEIFGSVALKNDTFFAGLGIEEASAKAIAALDENSSSYQLTMAYLDGINQYLEEGKTPIEFSLVGVKKEKFTIKDVYNIFGYMSFSFAMAQKSDPLLTDIRNKYGMEYLKDFGIDGSFNTTRIKNAKETPQEYIDIAKSIASLLDQSPIPPFVGSNSWVIAPKKTKNGKVIFANDPHIGFSQPGTWYEAHLVTPDFELYGCYLAGTPYPLLGHNREYAYGLTMFENDDIDLYQEENNPTDTNAYKTPNGFSAYEISKKIIKVKDTADVVLNLKVSRHGPIMNDLIDGLNKNKPVAMSWIYTQQPIQILDAVYMLSHAKSKADFHKGVALIAAPGLNVMYGDAKGNVAWWATGKLYKHNEGVNTNFILDGASGKDDITEYLDFSKNPSAENPNWNYVYSANNQPEPIDGFLYPGYYLPEDRAKRITQLLNPKSNWDKEAVSKMIFDNTSSVAPEVVATLISSANYNVLSQNEKEAIDILKVWSGSNNLGDVAPTIYNKWVYLYLKNTFEDELGEVNFKQFLGTHIMKQIIAKQMANAASLWWDNIASKNRKETRSQILSKSFKEAITALEKQLGNSVPAWTWNKVHTLEHQHPLGKVAALRKIFNVGPFEVSGSTEVINNLFFDFTDDGNYLVKGGPSTRRIIDFSDIENSWGILPTGQSGNPLSSHYSDQAELYNAGKFRRMKLNKEEIVRTSTKLVFIPYKK